MANAFALPTPARIAAIEQDNYRTKTIVLDMALAATPGQFVMAWLPRFDEKPFSLVNADPVTLMITAVGPFTELVHELGVGDRLWIRGPFGQGFAPGPEQRRLALVGGGYGVAPLLWLARRQLAGATSQGPTPQSPTSQSPTSQSPTSQSPTSIHAIIGARTADDVLYAARFEHAFADAGTVEAGTVDARVHVTTEDGSRGARGRVPVVLEPLLAAGEVDGIFACGPHGMLAALEELGARYQVPCQLSWEAYMRCAIGICGACEHDGMVLCMDGPVLATASHAR